MHLPLELSTAVMLQQLPRPWPPPQTQQEIALRALLAPAPTRLNALPLKPPPCYLFTLEYVPSGQLVLLPEILHRRHRQQFIQVTPQPVTHQDRTTSVFWHASNLTTPT
jgi:hypothetical protein